ncbi:tRNA-binding protein [Xenorhabdus hominickii]|nr:tRNA-binding protein [Xenorhabdus hominickii]
MSLDIRVGKIIKVEKNEKAIKPAYKLSIDFGGELGEKQSSAQICQNYSEEQLIGKQILAVVNFPPRRVAGFKSVMY